MGLLGIVLRPQEQISSIPLLLAAHSNKQLRIKIISLLLPLRASLQPQTLEAQLPHATKHQTTFPWFMFCTYHILNELTALPFFWMHAWTAVEMVPTLATPERENYKTLQSCYNLPHSTQDRGSNPSGRRLVTRNQAILVFHAAIYSLTRPDHLSWVRNETFSHTRAEWGTVIVKF